MPTIDPRIDEYIAKSADFAQPILRHLREVVHASCPAVEETMKWSMPHFMYNGILCNMASFKAHCTLGFWKGELLLAAEDDKGREAMGQFGRITSLRDLPAKKTLAGYIKKAMQLNAEGVQAPSRTKPKVARELNVPDYLVAALEAGGVRAFQWILDQRQTRVCGLVGRGQDRGNALAPHGAGPGMDSRGQAAQLEVYELLMPFSRSRCRRLRDLGGVSWRA